MKNGRLTPTRPPRDSQQTKVYRWESKMFGSKFYETEFSLEECRTFVGALGEAYGMKFPPCHVRIGRSKVYCHASLGGVSLAPWGMNRYVLTHEFTHWLIMKKGFGLYVAAHGPEFVWEYMKNLEFVGAMPLEESTRQAFLQGVKVRKNRLGLSLQPTAKFPHFPTQEEPSKKTLKKIKKFLNSAPTPLTNKETYGIIE